MKTIIPPIYERIDDLSSIEDFFKRESFRHSLTQLLNRTEEPLVVALDAKWGEGKTTFIKLWKRDLLDSHKDIIPIYYDAFRNDFSNEVFISIAVTIQKEITKYYERIGINRFSEERIKFYQNTAKKVGQELTKIAGTSAISFLSAGMIDTSTVWGHMLSKAIKFDELKNEELTNEKYDAFLSMQSIIIAYRNELKSLLKLECNANTKKIIFFVDELDRCKPLFAVEVIEKIKHLFSTEGVHFVLSINKDQILNTIKNAYGVSDKEAEVYLQKFVHIEANLPSVQDLGQRDDRKENLLPYLTYLKKTFDIPDDLMSLEKVNFLIESLNTPNHIRFVPRSIERLFTFYVTILKSCEYDFNVKNWRKIFFLCFLKLEANEIYNNAKRERKFRNYWWKGNKAEAYLGGLQKVLEDKFFNSDEYCRVSKHSADDFELLDFEEVFEIVDLYEMPKTTDLKKDISVKENNEISSAE